MENDEIIEILSITGKLMELHDENPFKTKAYTNAAFKLSKLRYDFHGKSKAEIASIEGIGSGISAKIFDLINTGSIPEFQVLIEKTPPGVIEMLGIKGLGPKKVRQLWQELKIESIGELLYACNENRLITLKGFGEKTQLQVKHSIEFKLSNQNKFHYSSVEGPVNDLVAAIKKMHPAIKIEPVGQVARKCEIIDKIQILIGGPVDGDITIVDVHTPLAVEYIFCSAEEFSYKVLQFTGTEEHLAQIKFDSLPAKSYRSEKEIYSELGLQFIPSELREGLGEVELASVNRLPVLIEMSDLKGILHNHTTASDGIHTLKEMADHCKDLGYGYLGICDHSKSAFYANGLTVDRVLQQQKEIDELNKSYTDFKVLKGIESDILNDGSLDYEEDILKTFDFVVASIHSNLKMSEEKATARLIKAIENPFTNILGHPTGRLLLARAGYPINHKKVIDACAANKVHIELNSHPYRLDIDWRWIPYCVEKDVKISINPDAHHKEAFHDMYYGICIARKGRLDRENCLNALPLNELINKIKK
jgi:DNA polymerase (family 10)